MNTKKLANWLQIVGNLGIVLGLMLVAFQINQAAEHTRFEIYQAQAYRQVDGDLALIGDSAIAAYSRAIAKPSELTVSDVVQLWSYLSATIVPSFVMWTSHEAKLVSDQDWNVQKSGVAFALDFPVGRAIWQQARLQFPSQFAAEIDEALAARSQVADGNLPTLFRAIVENVRTLPNLE